MASCELQKARKRQYRQRLLCECGKEIDSDYKDTHVRKVHKGEKVKFNPVVNSNQSQLNAFFGDSMKCESSVSTGELSNKIRYIQLVPPIDLSGDHIVKQDTEVEETILPPSTSGEQTISNPVLHHMNAADFSSSDSGDDQESVFDTISAADESLQNTIPTQPSAPSANEPNQPILKTYSPGRFGRESFLRDFSSQWYKPHPWLSFDVVRRQCECFPCSKYNKDNSFTLKNWKKIHRLKKHSRSANHKQAMLKWINAKTNAKRKSSVLNQLNVAHKQQVLHNRKYLRIIIESLAYTAQQNIAQRGHDENRQNVAELSDTNRGNFLELLHLRCKDIPWLKDKLMSQLKEHAQWTSPVIQNEIIQIISDCVLKQIVHDVLTSDNFAIIMDETSDVSRTEQVSLCLRYVTNGKTKETFVGFYSTPSTDGETLHKLTTRIIKELGLKLEDIVGECFDGASNMCGVHVGLATRMKECSPKRIYVHCHGHRLNLVLQDTMKNIEPLRNALGTIQSMYNFLEASPKRHALFSGVVVDDDHIERTLKSLSITRWSCRWEAVKAVTEQISKIVKVLLILSDDKNIKTYTDSTALLNAICSFDFVFGLLLLKVILLNINSLNKYLQGKKIDVINAKRNADLTMKTLGGCRNNNDFELLWSSVEIFCDKIKEEIAGTRFTFKEATPPRTKIPSKRLQSLIGESTADSNPTPSIGHTAKEHYRINTYFPSLDKIVSEMKERFDGKDQDILCALGDIVLNNLPKADSLELVSHFYGVDKDLLEMEKATYTHSIANNSTPRLDSAVDIVENMTQDGLNELLPVFNEVASILATIPATSCSAERSFSGLRRMKTYLRSTMEQERLSSIALINIERAYTNTVLENEMDNMIDIFGRRKGRDSYFF